MKEQDQSNANKSAHYVVEGRLAHYWERFSIWIACLMLSLCAWLFLEQRTEVKQISTEVQNLKVDKVSRQEFKDMEDRIYNRMDGMKGDIIFHINMLREKK